MTSAAVITIDGPGGAGKGTVTALVAKNLGFRTLDSGALYRILALHCEKKQIPLDQVNSILEDIADLPVDFVEGRVILDGEDVSDAIRSEIVGAAASQVAVYPAVRQALLKLQKSFAIPPGLVADGRDMGTVVFPQAKLKIFLTASAEERAQRRYKQLIATGQGGSLRALVEDIQARDRRDMDRETAPLRPAQDSVVIDSTGMTIEEVVEKILLLWQKANP